MNFSYVNTIEDYVEADKITRSINTLYKFFGIFLPWFIFSMVGVVLFFDIKSSGGTFAQLLCIVPVSYTHLDVYKRQSCLHYDQKRCISDI